MKSLFLAWQDKETRQWFPIGRLTEEANGYRFVYLQGVRSAQSQSGFQPLPSFPDLDRAYESAVLFPLFANRVMPQSRPDYPNYVEWLRLDTSSRDPLEYLEKSGGSKITDSLEMFPAPVRSESGAYTVHFFAHGLRHMPPEAVQRAEQLTAGEQLRLMRDYQNPQDPCAMVLATCKADSGDFFNVGYCPRYLAALVADTIHQDHQACRATVEQVNPAPAPVQFRLLCRLELTTANGEAPFSGPEFMPLATAD